MPKQVVVPIVLIFTLLLLLLLPFFFTEVLAAALLKLRLEPHAAILIVAAMLLGGAVNIPVKRIPRKELVAVHPFAALGLARFWPQLRWVRQETVIAINLGGCVIPGGLALYEAIQLFRRDQSAVLAVGVAVLINIVVCYFLAKPEPQIGIRMRPIVPAVTAAASAWLLDQAQAPAVAFIAGVIGPLVGADLLHLKQFVKETTGMASIGGAGSFDGIVLSAIFAVYLA